MNFNAALLHYQDGKKIRPTTSGKDYYISKKDRWRLGSIDQEDLDAEWEVVEEPTPNDAESLMKAKGFPFTPSKDTDEDDDVMEMYRKGYKMAMVHVKEHLEAVLSEMQELINKLRNF